MLIPIENVSQYGIITDIDAHDLPNEAWSEGQNVRVIDNRVEKFTGHSQVFGTASIVPYWLLPVQNPANYYWMYAGLDKVYVTQGGTHYNLTRQTAAVDVDYTGTADDLWTGGVVAGIPVLNNGVDDPQMWNPVSTSQRLTSLKYDASNDWAAKNYQTKILRPFKNYLVALDVTKASVEYPHMVKWSHPAVPGAVPETWDEADATKDAGRVS
jgi:hypothetical protein